MIVLLIATILATLAGLRALTASHDTDFANEIKAISLASSGGPASTTCLSSPFIYDAAGNLVLDDDYFYEYDAWGRVIKASAPRSQRVQTCTKERSALFWLLTSRHSLDWQCCRARPAGSPAGCKYLDSIEKHSRFRVSTPISLQRSARWPLPQGC